MSQALAEAERIKPVREAQIDVDDFKVSIPVALEAGGAVHERFAACWTVALLGLRVVGRLRGHNGPSVAPLIPMGYCGKPLKVFPSSDSQFLNVNLNRIEVRANHKAC